MRVNLVIPRHDHDSTRNGKRERLYLSAEAVAALDRLTTYSRSSAADLAIRLLDALASSNEIQFEAIGQELVNVIDSDNNGLRRMSRGFERISNDLLDATFPLLLP